MVDSPTPAQQPLSNQGQILLETLASLSYREQDLDSYLYEITLAATRLLGVDWSVVTCCDRHQYEVVASSLDIQFQQNSFNLHGSLTGRVVKSKSLSVRDTNTDNRYGIAPAGYRSYLGVPLKVPTPKSYRYGVLFWSKASKLLSRSVKYCRTTCRTSCDRD